MICGWHDIGQWHGTGSGWAGTGCWRFQVHNCPELSLHAWGSKPSLWFLQVSQRIKTDVLQKPSRDNKNILGREHTLKSRLASLPGMSPCGSSLRKRITREATALMSSLRKTWTSPRSRLSLNASRRAGTEQLTLMEISNRNYTHLNIQLKFKYLLWEEHLQKHSHLLPYCSKNSSICMSTTGTPCRICPMSLSFWRETPNTGFGLVAAT